MIKIVQSIDYTRNYQMHTQSTRIGLLSFEITFLYLVLPISLAAILKTC